MSPVNYRRHFLFCDNYIRMTYFPFIIVFVLAIVGYTTNIVAANTIRKRGERLHSISVYHGLYSLLLIFFPITILILVWLALESPMLENFLFQSLEPQYTEEIDIGAKQLLIAEIQSIASGSIFGQPEQWKIEAAENYVQWQDFSKQSLILAVITLGFIILLWSRLKVRKSFKARQNVERLVNWLLISCSIVAIITTVGIIASLLFETIRFFNLVPISEFLFGLNWEPQIPIRDDQVAGEGAFGFFPVILGTMVITVVALIFSVPIGLMSAIYLNEFAPQRFRSISKPLLEILAGVPTVVYGFFAILVVAPAIRSFGNTLGIDIAPNTALAAGGVMGIMIIPFISSFADDALSAVPKSLRDGSLALGATRAETMLRVLFPAAIPGIVGGILLAVSRAIGETMIVVMAAGLIAKLTINPLDSVTTVTVQIVTLLIGDTSFDNPKTLAAFALGMMLFLITLVINVFALRIVQKYREIYD